MTTRHAHEAKLCFCSCSLGVFVVSVPCCPGSGKRQWNKGSHPKDQGALAYGSQQTLSHTDAVKHRVDASATLRSHLSIHDEHEK